MADSPHILIVEARFYEDIADELVAGARAALDGAGVSYEIITVPGAFEIPAAIRMAIESGRFDGYVALGCVIRGETSHYNYVCNESARGLMDLGTRHGIAFGYGILTTDNREQAMVRGRRDQKDKGADAARACLAMIAHHRAFMPEMR